MKQGECWRNEKESVVILRDGDKKREVNYEL